MATAKKAAKKSAAKKAPAAKVRQLTKAGREAIAEAQRRRWAKFHKEQKAKAAGKKRK